MQTVKDSESDFDFSFAFKKEPFVHWLYTILPKISDKICKEYDFPKEKLLEKVEPRSPITIEELKRKLKNPTHFSIQEGFWTWDSRRVRYIGDDEENINKQIQKALNSDATKQYKEETLNKIKELVKQRA